MELTSFDITRFRLLNQQIATSDPPDPATTPGELVKRTGAFQAQDFGGAKWSIGLRIPGATEADIDQAIADKTIVRTWPMRGTLHFIPAADTRWMLDLMTPRIIAGSAARQRQLDLDDAAFARCRDVIREALQGGNVLTRAELLQRLDCEGVSTASQRGYHLLWRTAQEGLICFATPKGKQPAFALLEDWVPLSRRAVYEDRTEALGELARRYFTSHGPASLRDFMWWTGLRAADARTGLQAARDHLQEVVAEGETYWMPPQVQSKRLTADGSSGPVYLLPGFDEYMLGYRNRSAALDPLHARKIVPGGNGVFLPTIVSRGQVIGTWKRSAARKNVAVTTQPFRELTRDEEEALAVSAERYREYLQG